MKLLGIVNITPDSFSNDGLANKEPIDFAIKLIKDGAHILDIGAESTRPGATPLTANEEWQRLEKTLSTIINIAKESDIKTSLDTRYPENALRAIALGIDWINDVSGFTNLEMIKVLGKNNAAVLMHNLGVPADKNNIIDINLDPVEEVLSWGEKQINNLLEAGIEKNNIIFDPGIGFGKNSQQSLKLVRRIKEFKKLGVKILVGHSRKSFLGEITGNEAANRDVETIISSLYLADNGVDYVRVHNILGHVNALKIRDNLWK